MKRLLMFAAAALFATSPYGCAQAQPVLPTSQTQPAPTPQTPTSPPVLDPAYQAGFCAGWNALAQIEQQRYGNWRALVFASRTDEGAKTNVGQTTDLLVNSIPLYVLSQQAPDRIALADGRVVVCATAPAPGGAK